MQKYIDYDIFKHLEISYGTLPNDTIRCGWYAGQFRVHVLRFDEMAIRAIEAGAFDIRPFHQLQRLYISSHEHLITYHASIFHGLERLDTITLDERHRKRFQPDMDVFALIRRTLVRYHQLEFILDDMALTNMFGGQKLSQLRHFSLYCIGKPGQAHSLHAQNFSGLPAIRSVAMFECGIETVEMKAFSRIADTLESLHLIGNPMLKIDPMAIRKYLDANIHVSPRNKWFSISNEVQIMNCSCAFYALRNLTLISFGFSYFQYNTMLCNEKAMTGADKNDCGVKRHQQIIHLNRLGCIAHWLVENYVFERFELRTIRGKAVRLAVVQATYSRYRLVMWNVSAYRRSKRHKCPMRQWMNENVRCLRLRNEIEWVDLVAETQAQWPFVLACVIHVSAWRQSLPLHCVTLRWDNISKYDDEFDLMTDIALLMVYAMAVVSGFTMAVSVVLASRYVTFRYMRLSNVIINVID